MSKGTSVTFGFANTIFIGSDQYADDMSKLGNTSDDIDKKGTLVHEMAHIWQSQHGVWTSIRGMFLQWGTRIAGFFQGLFSDKGVGKSIDSRVDKLYSITGGDAKKLGGYNMEQQARAIERNYTRQENTAAGRKATGEEDRAQEIMSKTPSFPKKEALD